MAEWTEDGYKQVKEPWAMAWAARFGGDLRASKNRKDRYRKAFEAGDIALAEEHLRASDEYTAHANGMVEALQMFGYSYCWDDEAEKHIVIENRWW